jgi:hypothetical protein
MMTMGIDPRSVLPPNMARLVAQNEAAEAREQELAAYAAADDAQMAARLAQHQEDIHIAQTGVDSATWREAQARRGDALAAIGWDPSAPVGSEHRPAILVGGEELTPARPLEMAEEAQARRYDDAAGIDALLARNEAERAAWRDDPVMIRMRRDPLGWSPRRGLPPPRAGAVVARGDF